MCSVILNIILLFLFIRASSTHESKVATDRPKIHERPESRSEAGSPPSTAIVRERIAFNWDQLTADSYEDYVANLKAIQCPPATIVAIITSLIDEAFRSRATNLFAEAGVQMTYQYWRGLSFEKEHAAAVERYRSRLTSLNKERVALLKRVLGDGSVKDDLSWAPNPPSLAELRKSMDYLPENKREPVRAILEQVNQELMQLAKKGLDPDSLAAIARLKNDLYAKVSTILDPNELALFQMRTSDMANTIRDEFKRLDLSEAEFRSIFDVRKDTEARLNILSSSETEQKENERLALQKSMNDQTKAILGDQRFDEYLRLQTREYQDAIAFAEKVGLSQAAATEIYHIQSVATASANQTRSDQVLDAASRQQILNKIKLETENELRRTLGSDAFSAYSSSYRGNWLRNLGSAIEIPPARPNVSIQLINPQQ